MFRLSRLLVTGFVTLVALLGPSLPVSAALDLTPANRAATWLAAEQAADGSVEAGFGGPVDGTAETLIGVAAAKDPALQPSIDSMLAYLKSQASAYGVKPVGAAKLAVVADAYGLDVRTYFGVNAVSVIIDGYAAGTWGTSAFGDAWVILGLHRAGGTVTSAMIDSLVAQQDASGAFGYVWNGFNPDTDTTGLALMALTTSSSDTARTAAAKAQAWLERAQSADGSWPAYSPVNTTALAAMGLTARGASNAAAWSYLVSQQNASGGLLYGGETDRYATAQALPALGGVHYGTVRWAPVAAPTTPPAPTPAPTVTVTAAPGPRPTTTTTVRVPAPRVTVAAPRVTVAAPAGVRTVTVTATPLPEATVEATASPSATPSASSLPASSPTPVASPTPRPTPVTPTATGNPDLPWFLGGLAMLALAGAGAFALARRR